MAEISSAKRINRASTNLVAVRAIPVLQGRTLAPFTAHDQIHQLGGIPAGTEIQGSASTQRLLALDVAQNFAFSADDRLEMTSALDLGVRTHKPFRR
jgi:hypothetical protein